MDSLIIQSTSYTPNILLDADKGIIEIEGVSLPEDVVEFYSPVMRWFKDYIKWLDGNSMSKELDLRCTFKLNYYNSGSVRFLISILQHLKNMKEKMNKVAIEWFYEKDDIQMHENGRELEELLELRFSFIEYN